MPNPHVATFQPQYYATGSSKTLWVFIRIMCSWTLQDTNQQKHITIFMDHTKWYTEEMPLHLLLPWLDTEQKDQSLITSRYPCTVRAAEWRGQTIIWTIHAKWTLGLSESFHIKVFFLALKWFILIVPFSAPLALICGHSTSEDDGK